MSDAKAIARVDAPARAVIRDGVDNLYYVYEYELNHGWVKLEPARGYAHSTSAYAQLGRITNRENQLAILKLGA